MIACADVKTLNCIDDASKNCGTILSYPFFTSFIFLSAFMITNLFLAVIMDNFMYLTLDSSVVYCQHIHHFIAIWREFDPGETGRVHSSYLVTLLRRLPPPLGFGQHCPRRTVYAKLVNMDVPVDDKSMVWYKELLLILLIRCLRLRGKNELMRKDIQAIDSCVDEKILDSVLPTKHSKIRKSDFKIFCASNTIKYHFRVFVEMLKKVRQQQSDHDLVKCWKMCIGKNVDHKDLVTDEGSNVNIETDYDFENKKKKKGLNEKVKG